MRLKRSVVARGLAAALLLVGTTVAVAEEPAGPAPAPESEIPVYNVDFEARVVPTERAIRMTIRLGAGASAVEWMRFRIDPGRHRDFTGDGKITVEEGNVEWVPPRNGGELHYVFSIDHLRNARSYDARCANRWAIFRGGDMVPPARVRTDPVARSRSRLHLQLPEGWSAALPYRRTTRGYYPVQHPSRHFDRPTGWMVLGRIGVMREEISDMRVVVAGPAGHHLRRMDLLTLLRWNLPTVRALFGDLPSRFLVVGAGDPMWRGGLSGPESVFVHADRPLIDENASSPLLHELVHSLMRGVPGKGADWIAEGFAELYSVEILRRSNSISESRYQIALEEISERAAKGGELRAASVQGDTTAKAALTLRILDEEIRDSTQGARSLDDVLRGLASQRGTYTTSTLQGIAEEVAGHSLQAFFEKHVPALPPKP